MAEREGFEPSVPLPAHRFSRAAPSTTRSPLRTHRILTDRAERTIFLWIINILSFLRA
jgi:hypothetical protein